MSKRDRKSYFVAWELRDGTVVSVLEGRKPPAGSLHPGEKIDADGVYRRYIRSMKRPVDFEPWERAAYQAAVSAKLNTARLLRRQVEPHLVHMAKQLLQ